jgi:glycosyltransferase involved in cell wall biosynthesis
MLSEVRLIFSIIWEDCGGFGNCGLQEESLSPPVHNPTFMTGQTSAIIACYNGEAYLPEALDSICTQTRAVREVIVVDDGSDQPIQPPVDWRGPPLRIIRTENRGAAAARNLGVLSATGTFIALLDADDAWAPMKIEMQEDALSADPASVAVFTQRTEKPGWTPCPPLTYPPHDVSDDEFWTRLWRENFVKLSSIMIRRDVFLSVGGFDKRLPPCEDWEMWFRLLRAGRFIQVPLPLCYRRIHPQQLTKNFDQIVVYHRKCRLSLMREHGARIAAAGISREQQEKFSQEEYREHLLILYFRRRLSAARRLFWDYLLHYPSDVAILKYVFLSLLPQWFFVALRDRTDVTKVQTPHASRND